MKPILTPPRMDALPAEGMLAGNREHLCRPFQTNWARIPIFENLHVVAVGWQGGG